MRKHSLAAFLPLVVLNTAVGSALAAPVNSENDMSAPKAASPARTAAAAKAADLEPDSLAQFNHEALSAFKEHKYDLAQHLLEKVVAGLEEEKVSELSLAEALENLHLVLVAGAKTKEAEDTLLRARSIRAKFHLPPLEPRMVDILPNLSVRRQRTDGVKLLAEIIDGHDPLFPQDKLADKSPEAWSALMVTAQHERETGESKKAFLNYRKALAIANTFPKPNDKIVSTLNMLASVYRIMDKPSSARMLYLECMNLHQKMGKTETADYATLLDNAGQTFVVLHEYTEAEKILEHAISVFKKTVGPDSPDLAMAMCNLGEVYLMLKQDQKGEQTIAEALSIFRNKLKPEDMRVLITADNLAEVYVKHGKLKEAEDLQKSVIATMEKLVGKGVHPDLCVALNNLAQTLYKEKKYSEAEPMLKRCIDMNAAIYGEKHIKTVHAIGNYASFLKETGRAEESEKLLKQITAPTLK